MKTLKKTKITMVQVLDQLDDTINSRLKLADKYSKSDDKTKKAIAKSLEDNVLALSKVKWDLMKIEKNSEIEIFGD